jgi:hypothetical protein
MIKQCDTVACTAAPAVRNKGPTCLAVLMTWHDCMSSRVPHDQGVGRVTMRHGMPQGMMVVVACMAAAGVHALAAGQQSCSRAWQSCEEAFPSRRRACWTEQDSASWI